MSDRQNTTAADPHPWYGPCDGLGESGECAECRAVTSNPDYARHAAQWWKETQARWAREAERRAARKARRQARVAGAAS